MQDIPYSSLKQKRRAYEIMLLRDQHGMTYHDIAKKHGISATRVVQEYYEIKRKQRWLYIYHISAALGYKDASQIQEEFSAAYEWYWDLTCTCAYLERKYKDILTEYRAGELGMPAWFMEKLPPFKPALSQTEQDRVIEMRDAEKKTYQEIGTELGITPAKARRVYDTFYHKKVMALIMELTEKAENAEEREAVRDYFFKNFYSSKKRYDALMKGSVIPSEFIKKQE